MLYEAKQKIECINITEIDAIQGHGTERKTVRKKDMVSTFERCYSLQELNTNLEECPLLTGRSKLSSLLLRKLGVEQSRHIYFFNNGTEFRPQQFRGIVYSQQTSSSQHLSRIKQDIHPHKIHLGNS
jgi:hypothetical protein